jgi:hypothetical protein
MAMTAVSAEMTDGFIDVLVHGKTPHELTKPAGALRKTLKTKMKTRKG